MPWTLEEICEATCETIRANGLKDGYIRLVVTRGVGDLGLNPYLCPNPSMFIIALSPQVKSLNYLNNVMAKVEALKAGAKEGLMLNEQGYVAECTGDNVFIVKKGVVYTPPVSDGSLDGITRQVVFDLCEELGIEIREVSMTRYDVYTADESFLTGTAAETIPMVKLDEREIGDGKPGPLSTRLIAAYSKKVRSEGTAF